MTNELLNDQTLIRINKLSNDLAALKHFIDSLDAVKHDGIKALYIVTKKNYQIELKNHFSDAAAGTLLNLIVNNRRELARELETVLVNLVEANKQDLTKSI
jgi:hypothetical protein